jgi:hypothetical protein
MGASWQRPGTQVHGDGAASCDHIPSGGRLAEDPGAGVVLTVNPGTGPASETRLAAAADISKTAGTIAYASRHSHSTKAQQNYYYNEYHEGISEIANSLLKMLLNQMVDNTMVAAVKEK